MAKYEKWLGAGLGWVVGGPLGSLLGFIAGNLIKKDTNSDTSSITKGLTEFEVNLIVLASHLVKVDGKVSLSEVSFLDNFLNQHFNETPSAARTQVINHCMQKEYDLSAACDQIRINTPHQTRQQVVHFLFDLAMCDGDLTERENYFIFRIAGYLNVNDVDFRRIKKEHNERPKTLFEILGVSSSASMSEIRTAYRRLVLKYHPDRNKNASEAERKKLAAKFQQIQEAYEKFKNEK